jgi:ABC-type antimicrobial peptide transport system permease subunit
MADKFWPGQDPLGHHFGQGDDRAQWFEVVGVVGNVRARGLADGPLYEFYQTVDQGNYGYLTVVVKTAGVEPESVIPAARQIVASLDPLLPISSVQTMNRVVADSVGQPRLLTAVASVFGLAAALLSMVGVYGVMTYNVRRERREFGIRIALGAERRQVEGLVLSRGFKLAGMGVGAGIVGALGLSRFLGSMLNDVKPTDPWVFAATAIAVVVVTLASSYLPARRASGMDPASILKSS